MTRGLFFAQTPDPELTSHVVVGEVEGPPRSALGHFDRLNDRRTPLDSCAVLPDPERTNHVVVGEVEGPDRGGIPRAVLSVISTGSMTGAPPLDSCAVLPDPELVEGTPCR